MDELRYRTQQSPRNDPPMNSLVSPPRNGGRMAQAVPNHDPRATLPRRFTTDSGRVPTMSNLATQRSPDAGQDYQTPVMQKVQLIERKKKEYERLRQQRERFELEMQKLDQAQRQEAQDLAALQEDLGRMGLSGHQSEPTTPPEYRETTSGFPTMLSRPNRYSTSSLTSPPGLFNRPGRSGSQIASPQAGILQNRFAFDDQLPSKSVPGSRRNSDEDEKEEAVRQDPTSHRSTNALNRYSMPVTRSRNGMYDMGGLDQTNTTRFLFGDEENSTQDSKYGQAGTVDENFPTLVRREDHRLSASSAALDLALAPTPEPEAASTNGWGNINRHRTQASMSGVNGSTGGQVPSAADAHGNGVRPSSIRHSLDMKFYGESASDVPATMVSPATNHIMTSPPKLHSSFSANDVPTVKSTVGMPSNANSHAQQHFHNHNASLGRIPAGAMPNRHSRELSTENSLAAAREQAGAYHSIQSALHANAPAFGPGMPAAMPPHNSAAIAQNVAANGMVGPFGPYYGGNYNVANMASPPGSYNALAMSVQAMGLNNGNGPSMYSAQNYTGYGAIYNHTAQPRDSQARVIQNRRQLDNDAMQRYQNMPLEQFCGGIYELCKDQHGCRYLQKQLEERIPEHVHMIWLETNQHVVELMTDPFGNYLCQKLLEFCNDEERTCLIQNATVDLVRIALNQHGTRALQKMIEFISTPEQIQLIIEALRFRVVELIQDLNGNHVIQKCLNKLGAQDAQFIFDAVGNNCIDVGTHRHGCCVLQRCIDHASGEQKVWLIRKITENAPILVQDPFGNYVVQYIIDLNVPDFTEPLVEMFRGRICQLSRHKFSSNVIEKCLRCAQDPSKDMIVDEILSNGEVERLIRDSFANYVVQTALEYATPDYKNALVEAIRPLLPSIRQTPYGRRIAAKVTSFDHRGSSANTSGQITPSDNSGGQIPIRPQHNRNVSNGNQMQHANSSPFANGFTNGTQGPLAPSMSLSSSNGQAFTPSSAVTVPAPVRQGQGLSQAQAQGQQQPRMPNMYNYQPQPRQPNNNLNGGENGPNEGWF